MRSLRIFFNPLCVQGTKPWAGNTIYEQPLGGSESAVIYLARELARRGHQVTVFASGNPGTYEGVTYLHYTSFVPTPGLCDVIVASRWPDLLNSLPDYPARKVLWMHDMPQVPELNVNADKIVFLTNAHAGAWGANPGAENVVIEGDGVDPTLATGREFRDINRLLWISNPDRGLWLACKFFVDEILPRWPDMTFDIYGRASVYGWPASKDRFYLPTEDIMGRSKGAITLKDPLPRLGLMRELMKSWALFYPTYWPETFCMSTLEAQMAGTPVITSPVAALRETVKGGIVTNDLLNAVSQLRNKNKWKELSNAGKEYAAEHTWAKVAMRWEQKVFGGL